MSADGGTSPAHSSHPAVVAHRQSRWLGQGYADITKLREFAARHDRMATRNQQRAARLSTRIEKMRHQATVLREKAQSVEGQIPEIEREIAQLERDIKAATEKTHGRAPAGSDVTALQFRVRKLQQRIVDRNHKARSLEHRAAQKTQKTAELKVKVDRYMEQSKLEEQEGLAYRQRADRLQMATEGEVGAQLAHPPAAEAGPRDVPGPQ